MPIYILIIALILLVASLIWIIVAKSKFSVLGVAFLIGISIFAMAFWQSRRPETSLRVVGYASKLFESDLVKWNVSLQKNVSAAELSRGYRDMNSDIMAFKSYLIEQGLAEKDISIQPASSYQRFDNNGNMTGYNINQSIFVLSQELDLVEDLALNSDFFADRSIVLNNSRLEYLYTKLPVLKKELLAAATEDALARAFEIASSAGTGLGKLREARAGVFQITEPYSTDVSDYGIYNTSTRQKSISVTLTGYFGLR
nr:uncharacterized protein [Candidatus Cloacimonadota bacterium]